VLIALDRMERSGKDDALSAHSAVQEVSQNYNMPVISIGNLNDLMDYIAHAGSNSELANYKNAVSAYRQRYGVT
jgi:orotate phosphoribosyltransferase